MLKPAFAVFRTPALITAQRPSPAGRATWHSYRRSTPQSRRHQRPGVAAVVNGDRHCRVPLALHSRARAIEVADMNGQSHGGDGPRVRGRCAQVVGDRQRDRVRAGRRVCVPNVAPSPVVPSPKFQAYRVIFRQDLLRRGR